MRGRWVLADEFGIHRLTLRLPGPTEAAFSEDDFARSIGQVRAALLVSTACLVAAWPINEWLFPEHLVAARALLAGTTGVLLALTAFSVTSWFKVWMRWGLALAHAQFALYAPFLLLVRNPDLDAIGSLCIAILVANAFTFSRMGFLHALGTGLILLVAWLAALAQPGMSPPYLFWGYVATLGSLFLIVAAAGYFLDRSARREFVQRALLSAEREKSDRLLFNMLPRPVADRLRQQPGIIADRFENVTVLFADLVGFTPLTERVPPEQMVGTLNEMFSVFDDLAVQHGVEKIKTIGDGYNAVAGVPHPCADHAKRVAALDMLAAIRRLAAQAGWDLNLRIGLASGPVIAGVIGRSKYVYEVWGDTANTASRMESHGLPGRVQVTRSTYERLRHAYDFEPRGPIDVKGKGQMETFLLVGPASHTEPPTLGAPISVAPTPRAGPLPSPAPAPLPAPVPSTTPAASAQLAP